MAENEKKAPVKKPKGAAIVLIESQSVEMATPSATDKRAAEALARAVGTGVSQLWNATEKDFEK